MQRTVLVVSRALRERERERGGWGGGEFNENITRDNWFTDILCLYSLFSASEHSLIYSRM